MSGSYLACIFADASGVVLMRPARLPSGVFFQHGDHATEAKDTQELYRNFNRVGVVSNGAPDCDQQRRPARMLSEQSPALRLRLSRLCFGYQPQPDVCAGQHAARQHDNHVNELE